MYSEAKKLYLIEELLKIDSDAVLVAIETVLSSYNGKVESKASIYDFVGIISRSDVFEMQQAITSL